MGRSSAWPGPGRRGRAPRTCHERRPRGARGRRGQHRGGAPGDGTEILAELLEQGAHGAVVPIVDAEVALAAACGWRGVARVELGGKTDEPVHRSRRARVVRITDGRYRGGSTWKTGQSFSMGMTAVLDAGGIVLVVMERPVPPFHAEQLLSVGIEPRDAALIVVKGAVAWRSAVRRRRRRGDRGRHAEDLPAQIPGAASRDGLRCA